MDRLTLKNRSDINRLLHTQRNDFMYTSTMNPWTSTAIATGTIGAANNSVKHPGVVTHNSSTSANSGLSIRTATSAIVINGGEETTFIFKTAATLTGVSRYMGYHNSSTASAPTDGVYCAIIDGTISGKCTNNSSTSTTGTSQLLTAATWYRLKIVVNPAGTLATFIVYADDSSTVVWTSTVATNIPTGRGVGSVDTATYSGTSAIELGSLDYAEIYLPYTRVI